METLREIYNRYKVDGDYGIGDKGALHSYIDEYERLLAPYRFKSTFLEIGINRGHSLKMFAEYFVESKVIGIEIWPGCKDFFKDYDHECQLIIGDGTKELPELKDIKFDVIIDDGSHMLNDQIASFNIYSKRMNPGGIYIIEDILNLDAQLPEFRKLGNCEVIDNRKLKGRFDDILIVFRF
jgi:cyclopropane fatty-acyl-phospholipid synthase-like methyltransferase